LLLIRTTVYQDSFQNVLWLDVGKPYYYRRRIFLWIPSHRIPRPVDGDECGAGV